MIAIKRAFEPATPEDGPRYLVDRIWPRGTSKEKAALAGWLRDLAPSTGLRQWFGHDPARWEEFRQRYLLELGRPEARELLARLRREAAAGTVTLVFAAKDEARNNAVVLKELLDSGA